MTESAFKQQHPFSQLIIFVGMTAAIILAGYVLGAAVVIGLYGVETLMEILQLNLNYPNTTTGLWILQIVSTTIPILVSAIVFAKYVMNDTGEYLKATFKFPWVLLLIIFCLMLASAPFIEALGNINQQLKLPGFLAGIEKWMRDTEGRAQTVTVALAEMKTIDSMIFKLLMIGLLTAIVEEFMFRGCMQTIFMKWTKNVHAAVWITAALFSAFHFEFFGFLPRLMLGALFGYFVVWSGSIWTAIWAHFINNGTAVVWSYLYQNKVANFNPDDTHLFNLTGYLFSLIIILFLLYLYRNIAMGKWKMPAK